MGGHHDTEKACLNENLTRVDNDGDACGGSENVALETLDVLLNASGRQKKHRGKNSEVFLVPLFEVCALQ
jgi:hypothetical protein